MRRTRRPKLNALAWLPGSLLAAMLLAALAAGPVAGTTGGDRPAARGAASDGPALVLTPPMGFTTWNAFGCRIDEGAVRDMADAMVDLGLRAAGYTYLNIDDCWGAPTRDDAGKLAADPTRFPSGIAALGGYLHDRGLKLGIYSSAGTFTCNKGGFPGALGHELSDARQFAGWGVDYLKYDNCHHHGVNTQQRYLAMRHALDRVRRPIVYSISEWGLHEPWTWAPSMSNLWRTSRDIHDSWASLMSIVHVNEGLWRYSGPGHWNDPDALEIGNGGMTDTEQRTQMSLWAMMAAPLLISTDLRTADAATLAILLNREVVALDQDPLGRQATVVRSGDGLATYVKPLANGDRAVALLNEGDTPRRVRASASQVGLPGAGSYHLRDLWSKQTRTTSGAISALVPAHGTVLYRVRAKAARPPKGTTPISAIEPTAARNGWGPVERDASVGGRAAGDGQHLRIGGVGYARGLGVHAASEVTYRIDGRCSRFQARVGVDDEVGDQGSVVFRVLADGHEVARSQTLRGADGSRALVASLDGARTLSLVVEAAGDGRDFDHADWAHATLTCR